ncbi:hypothetical protein BT69DRAFT_1289353 [Atractiella rhizophila]|nr:hypothetical protein BT69DRAFT_1289353 [Atractiella rhizophila]
MEKEEKAYSALRLLQRSTIPKSYGFYNRRPHLMEFVDGPCLHDVRVRHLPEAEQRDFFTKGMMVIAAIFLLGIVHGDLVQRPDQIICPTTSPDVVNFGLWKCE